MMQPHIQRDKQHQEYVERRAEQQRNERNQLMPRALGEQIKQAGQPRNIALCVDIAQNFGYDVAALEVDIIPVLAVERMGMAHVIRIPQPHAVIQKCLQIDGGIAFEIAEIERPICGRIGLIARVIEITALCGIGTVRPVAMGLVGEPSVDFDVLILTDGGALRSAHELLTGNTHQLGGRAFFSVNGEIERTRHAEREDERGGAEQDSVMTAMQAGIKAKRPFRRIKPISRQSAINAAFSLQEAMKPSGFSAIHQRRMHSRAQSAEKSASLTVEIANTP